MKFAHTEPWIPCPEMTAKQYANFWLNRLHTDITICSFCRNWSLPTLLDCANWRDIGYLSEDILNACYLLTLLMLLLFSDLRLDLGVRMDRTLFGVRFMSARTPREIVWYSFAAMASGFKAWWLLFLIVIEDVARTGFYLDSPLWIIGKEICWLEFCRLSNLDFCSR